MEESRNWPLLLFFFCFASPSLRYRARHRGETFTWDDHVRGCIGRRSIGLLHSVGKTQCLQFIRKRRHRRPRRRCPRVSRHRCPRKAVVAADKNAERNTGGTRVLSAAVSSRVPHVEPSMREWIRTDVPADEPRHGSCTGDEIDARSFFSSFNASHSALSLLPPPSVSLSVF